MAKKQSALRSLWRYSQISRIKDRFENLQYARVWRERESDRRRGAPTALLVGFVPWKTYILRYLNEYNVVTLSHGANVPTDIIKSIVRYPSPHVFTWSYKFPADLKLFCTLNSIPMTFVEDGFIRSAGLGADRTTPASLVFDQKAMHFDRLTPSSLEETLRTYNFSADDRLMRAALELSDLLIYGGVSKYMFRSGRSVRDVQNTGKDRVLVLGQVEDDLSIRYGAERPMSGNELVMLAAAENPTAQILYRPHPESIAYSKPHYSDPMMVTGIATILGPEYGIADCLDHCDRVYTITSLAGFEAALRGKPVTTIGSPFYSGWGFTEDRLSTGRRHRRLSPLEVLAAAYILYPRYAGVDDFDPDKPKRILDVVRRFAGLDAIR